MRSLLKELGAVCARCSTWTPPGGSECAGCGAHLPVVDFLHGAPAAPEPAADAEGEDIAITEESLPSIDAPAGPTAELEVACAGCGRILPDHLRFCPTCGTRLATRTTPGPTLEPGRVRLLLLRGLGPPSATLPLVATETTVGRDRCTLRFPADDTLPGHAASLIFRDGRLLVRNVGASCVFVRLRHPEPIAPGTAFSIGDQLLRFSGCVAPPATPPPGVAVFGSPLPGIAPHLRVERVLLGGSAAAAWLRPSPVRIGRSTGEIRFPDDPFVSSRHCELVAHPRGALLRDLDSSNGTFVQLLPGGERELLLGDTLRIGRNILRVEAND